MSRDSDAGDDAVERDLASLAVERRKLLSAVGAAGMAAIAGCSGQTGAESPTNDETVTTQPMQSQTPQEQDSIDPRFGYTATSMDETPPVEPDHTVTLELRPRQDREVPEFYFEPAGLAIEVGDTVQFQLNSPHHNVNAYHPAFGYNQRVPDDVPPFSSPILSAGESWLYTFEQEGVHDYVCAPHEIFGMAGRVVVGSASGPGANPVGEAPGGERARAPDFTAGLVLADDAMAPENILEQGSVSWSEIADENKRMLLAPVEE